MFPVYPFIHWLHILWSDSGWGIWITKIKDANVEWRLGKKKKETLNEFVLLGTLRICSFNYADLQLENENMANSVHLGLVLGLSLATNLMFFLKYIE